MSELKKAAKAKKKQKIKDNWDKETKAQLEKALKEAQKFGNKKEIEHWKKQLEEYK